MLLIIPGFPCYSSDHEVKSILPPWIRVGCVNSFFQQSVAEVNLCQFWAWPLRNPTISSFSLGDLGYYIRNLTLCQRETELTTVFAVTPKELQDLCVKSFWMLWAWLGFWVREAQTSLQRREEPPSWAQTAQGMMTHHHCFNPLNLGYNSFLAIDNWNIWETKR